jgi:CRP/FNR family transcriptional regulator
MEQRLISLHQVTDRNVGGLGVPACKTPGSVRCGMPLGLPMICGDTRHREDRAADSEVIAGGSPSHDVWLIRTGLLRLQRYAYDGRRQILSLFLPGEIIGFDGEFREGVSVETATQCGLCRIDRRKFDRMVDQDDILRADLFRQKQDQLDRLHWLTWSLGALGPEERLCAFLALSTKFMPYQLRPDGSGILSVQLPRKDIADLLATTVESTSRIVHKLSKTGVLEIIDPSHFRLLDLPRLIGLGQIEGLFDRMTCGPAKGASHLEHLVVMGSDSPVCLCGR